MVLGVVVVMMVVFLGFWELGGSFNNGGEKERDSYFSLHSKWVLFIEHFRVGEDPVRTGRISDRYNPKSWPFGLLVPLL